jgi:hypothetical protein
MVTLNRTLAAVYLLAIATTIALASPSQRDHQALSHCLKLHPAKYCHLTYGNQS